MLDSIIGSAVEKVRSALINLTIGEIKNASDDLTHSYKYLNRAGLHLGLDIDGTITEQPEFFRNFSKSWPGRVSIISYRSDESKAIELLRELDIYYDDIYLVKSLDKSDMIIKLGVNVYVDDQDECILNIPENVTVLKVRNGGNFQNKKWIYSDQTGRLLI